MSDNLRFRDDDKAKIKRMMDDYGNAQQRVANKQMKEIEAKKILTNIQSEMRQIKPK